MDIVNKGLKVVLLGKTGVGKSSAGNTILGREAFKSMKSSKSVTRDIAFESGAVGRIPVTVYDTPGLFDTYLNEEETTQKIKKVLQECESGPSVFLLVIKADRFTEEERKTVEKIEKLLGEKHLKNTWILFTRGDELEEENITIRDFINDTEALKKLLQKYDQRYHVFNNKKLEDKAQVKRLILKILNIQSYFDTQEISEILMQSPLRRKITEDLDHHTLVSSLQSRRIVLLGKSGVGKSAAGNTILGQREFASVMSTNSVTSVCSDAQTTVSGRSVSVVDTPGFFDTKMKPEDLVEEIARSIYLASPGPHAFLIVFPVNMRFTEHEQQIPQIIEMMFGQEVLKYSIILFTHGDLLKEKTIEELIEENSRLRRLVNQCGGRYQVFNNRDENNRQQVNDLLQMIDTMIEQNGGGHYSNQMFEDALRFRREEEERRLRGEEERQQLEQLRQNEIARPPFSLSQRTRAQIQHENNKRRKQQQNQRREEIEKVRKETEKRVRAECKAQYKSLLQYKPLFQNEPLLQVQRQLVERKKQQGEGIKQFLSKYGFYLAVIGGLIIGGGIVGFFAGGMSAEGALLGGGAVGAVGAVCAHLFS